MDAGGDQSRLVLLYSGDRTKRDQDLDSAAPIRAAREERRRQGIDRSSCAGGFAQQQIDDWMAVQCSVKIVQDGVLASARRARLTQVGEQRRERGAQDLRLGRRVKLVEVDSG